MAQVFQGLFQPNTTTTNLNPPQTNIEMRGRKKRKIGTEVGGSQVTTQAIQPLSVVNPTMCTPIKGNQV